MSPLSQVHDSFPWREDLFMINETQYHSDEVCYVNVLTASTSGFLLLQNCPLFVPKSDREQSITNVVVNGDLTSSSHHLEMHGGSCLNIDQIIYFLKDIRIRSIHAKNV